MPSEYRFSNHINKPKKKDFIPNRIVSIFFLALSLSTFSFIYFKKSNEKITSNPISLNQSWGGGAKSNNLEIVAGESDNRFESTNGFESTNIEKEVSRQVKGIFTNSKNFTFQNGILKLKNNSITSNNIKNHTIEEKDIDGSSITSRTIKNNSIQGEDIDTDTSITIDNLTAVTISTDTLTTSNTTLVTNLNADLLDGQHGSYYQPASTALTTTTSFTGDVTGTYNSIVITDDSHNHTATTISDLTTADFTSQNISQWTNNSNYIIASSTISGLIQSATSGNSYFTGGNVGIGLTAPNSKLEVTGDIRISTGSGGQLIFADGSTMNSAGAGSATAISNTTDAIITGDSDANSSGGILLKTGSNTRLAILNGGNVGINNTNPTYALEITGTLGLSGQLTSTLAIGTAPFLVTSTTLVNNLNADQLDGNHASYFLNTGTNFGGDVSGTYGAIAVADDSHSHTSTTLPALTSYLGSAIESSEITDATITTSDLSLSLSLLTGQSLSYGLGTLTANALDTALTYGVSVSGNASTVTNGLYSNGSYSDPTWLSGLSGTKISSNISTNAANVTGTVTVPNGGTGATTFTKGIIVSPGTTTAFTSVTGTDNYLLKWSSSYPSTTSLVYDNGTNVGIGTTNPITKLEIYDNATANLFRVRTGAIEALYIDSSGLLGIGTTAPHSKLSVSGGMTIGSGYTAVMGDGNVAVEGNVGIGTTNPTAKLEIGGTAGTDGIKYPDGTTQTSAPCGSVVYDADNNAYGTAPIGTQCWMTSNMRTTKYPNGSSITRGAVGGGWNGSDNGYYAYPPNTVNNAEESLANIIANNLGFVYQWSAAMNGSTTAGARGICPVGWHIPTDAQQHILDNYLKDTEQTCDASRVNAWDCSGAGTKMKSGGYSIFNAPLAGFRYTDGSFYDRTAGAYLWSSSESGTSAWTRYLYSGDATVDRGTDSKAYGFSVRCLKD